MILGMLRMEVCDPSMQYMNKFWAVYEIYGFTAPLVCIQVVNATATGSWGPEIVSFVTSILLIAASLEE